MKEQQNNNKQQRIRKKNIGNTVYTIISEEMPNAKNTLYDIVDGLIKRHLYEVRTCCLDDGGNDNVANG
ncbi:MAG: hypothetical protein LUD27_05010 [Clostridia bacterium]|nr:hypothetical protein [Clostridia bacterium]